MHSSNIGKCPEVEEYTRTPLTGRRSDLSEAAHANVRENWRPKGVLCEETADTRFDCVSEVGDRAAF